MEHPSTFEGIQIGERLVRVFWCNEFHVPEGVWAYVCLRASPSLPMLPGEPLLKLSEISKVACDDGIKAELATHSRRGTVAQWKSTTGRVIAQWYSVCFACETTQVQSHHL